MKEVILVLGETQYKKTEPSIKDWYRHLELIPKVKNKNLLVDKDAADLAIKFVAEFLGCDPQEIHKFGNLGPVIKAYHRIEKNISEAFEEAMGEWGNVDTPEPEQK